jgi:hypothetical protein
LPSYPAKSWSVTALRPAPRPDWVEVSAARPGAAALDASVGTG